MIPMNTEDRRLVGAALIYLLFVLVLAKAMRTADMVGATDSWIPLAVFPLTFGPDLIFAAVVFLALRGLVRWLGPRAGLASAAGLVALAAFWMFSNVLAYRLTQAGLTLQRFMGSEGATLADLDLIEVRDWLPDLLAATALMALSYPAISWMARRDRPGYAGSWKGGAAVAVAGVVLTLVVQFGVGRYSYGLEEQPFWVFAVSLFEEDELESLELSSEEWKQLDRGESGQEVAGANVQSQARRPRNAIVWLAEGIPLKHTSLGRSPFDPTPHLAKRGRHGLSFDRYYSPYHKSIHAIFSVVCSDYPPPGPQTIVQFNPRIDCGEASEILAKRGVVSALYHGGRFGFYDKLSLLGERAYDEAKDSSDMASPKWFTDKWGIDDRAMVEALFKWVDSRPADEPFFALLITIAPHYPYHLPRDFKSRITQAGALNRYLNGVAFQDMVFEELMKGLDERGLSDDTLVAWVADHGEYIDEPPRENRGSRLAYQPNVHVPLVLINPLLFPEHQVSHRLGSHVDLLPTILDLMGLEPDARHRGQSLVSEDFEARRVFVGGDRGGRRYVGMIDGDLKFIAETRKKTMELYDLSTDPDELENLATDFPEKAAELYKTVRRFQKGQLTRLKNAPTIGKRRDVHAEVFANARVSVVTGQGETECLESDNDGRRLCPGQPDHVYLAREERRVKGKMRDCLRLHIPEPGGRFELTLTGNALSILSAARIGIPDKLRKKKGAPVSAYAVVDGRKTRSVRVTDRNIAKRLEFPHAGQSVTIAVSSKNARNREVCLTLSDVAWYNR